MNKNVKFFQSLICLWPKVSSLGTAPHPVRGKTMDPHLAANLYHEYSTNSLRLRPLVLSKLQNVYSNQAIKLLTDKSNQCPEDHLNCLFFNILVGITSGIHMLESVEMFCTLYNTFNVLSQTGVNYRCM